MEEDLEKAIRGSGRGGAVVGARRAATLAALQGTSELCRAREANGSLTGAMQGLSADVRRLLPPGKRDSAAVPVALG